MSGLANEYRLRDHLEMYWLRPESALWDAIAAKYIGEALAGRENILELGLVMGFLVSLCLVEKSLLN